VGSNKGKHQKI